MKKLIIFAFIAVNLTVFSQEENPSVLFKQNEIKLNVGALSFGFPEFSYERLLGSDMGVGISGMISLFEESSLEYQIVPFYRMYFAQKRPSSGFFIEVNAALVAQSEEQDFYYTFYPVENKKEQGVFFGVGAAVGVKWLNSRGLVGEAFVGAGRIYGDPFYEVYPRVGVSIGKRF